MSLSDKLLGWGGFGWTTLVHGRCAPWAFCFVRHPAASGGWTLGVGCDAGAMGCCVVGVVES